MSVINQDYNLIVQYPRTFPSLSRKNTIVCKDIFENTSGNHLQHNLLHSIKQDFLKIFKHNKVNRDYESSQGKGYIQRITEKLIYMTL